MKQKVTMVQVIETDGRLRYDCEEVKDIAVRVAIQQRNGSKRCPVELLYQGEAFLTTESDLGNLRDIETLFKHASELFNEFPWHQILMAVSTDLQKDGSIPTGTPRALPTHPLSEFPPEDTRWLWPFFIPANQLTLVEGDPGLGKTYLLLAACAAVTRGYHLPDQEGHVGEPDTGACGNVVYITAEDGLRNTIRVRADAVGANTDRIFVSTLDELFPKGQPAFTLANLAPLEAAIQAREARLVVLDPLQAFLGAKVDIHRTNEVRPLMTALAALAERCDCSVIAVRHWTKAPGGKAIYRGQSSIDFAAAARSVLVVGRSPENRHHRIMAQNKTNLTGETKSVVFAITDTGLEWVGTSDITADELSAAQPERQQSRQRGEAMDWLRDALATGPQTAKGIEATAEAAGIASNVLRRAREHLRVETYKSGAAWYWRLPTIKHWADYDDDIPL